MRLILAFLLGVPIGIVILFALGIIAYLIISMLGGSFGALA
jgi:hypothetical protein